MKRVKRIAILVGVVAILILGAIAGSKHKDTTPVPTTSPTAHVATAQAPFTATMKRACSDGTVFTVHISNNTGAPISVTLEVDGAQSSKQQVAAHGSLDRELKVDNNSNNGTTTVVVSGAGYTAPQLKYPNC